MATDKQIKYIEVLLIDCRFKSRAERNCYLSREFDRDIHYLDELDSLEASRLIDMLKEMKEEKWEEEALSRSLDDYDPRDDYRK